MPACMPISSNLGQHVSHLLWRRWLASGYDELDKAFCDSGRTLALRQHNN